MTPDPHLFRHQPLTYGITRLSIALHWARGNLRDSDLLLFCDQFIHITFPNDEGYCIFIANLSGISGFRELVRLSSRLCFRPGFCGFIFRTTHPRVVQIANESGAGILFKNANNPHDVRYHCAAEGSKLLRLAYAEKNKILTLHAQAG